MEFVPNYDETKAGHLPWPSPLRRPDGSFVRSATEWNNSRREEVRRTISDWLFGELPPRPESVRYELRREVGDALGGAAIRGRCEFISSTAADTIPSMCSGTCRAMRNAPVRRSLD